MIQMKDLRTFKLSECVNDVSLVEFYHLKCKNNLNFFKGYKILCALNFKKKKKTI